MNGEKEKKKEKEYFTIVMSKYEREWKNDKRERYIL